MSDDWARGPILVSGASIVLRGPDLSAYNSQHKNITLTSKGIRTIMKPNKSAHGLGTQMQVISDSVFHSEIVVA